jgi:hypothetical protein
MTSILLTLSNFSLAIPYTMSALKVFLTTWNTGLQGSKAQSQDLTSWLLPVLQSSDGPNMPKGEIPDIYAIGIQELLPLHLARKLYNLAVWSS